MLIVFGIAFHFRLETAFVEQDENWTPTQSRTTSKKKDDNGKSGVKLPPLKNSVQALPQFSIVEPAKKSILSNFGVQSGGPSRDAKNSR